MKKLVVKILCIILVLSLITSCSKDSKSDNSKQEKSYDMNYTQALPEMEKKESLNINTDMNTEEYSHIQENNFKASVENPLSTFSIDVDTASYSNIRRFLMDGNLPPKDSVRIEEMINYFKYDYENPNGEVPFNVITEISKCPWNENHDLAMIALKGKEIEKSKRPNSNLVFLLDVSGSMNDPDKLPLLKSAFKLLVNELNEGDKVSIVVYAGSAGIVLDSTSGDEKTSIIDALDRLQAGGSTAGGEGINLAYKIAKENFIEGGNNRILLATDGDFNVGPSSDGDLTRLIEKNRNEGVFLSVLGFGTGNLKDSKAEILADKGNGNYSYIDSILEAKKVLVDEIGSTLFTIAKDVKLQIEFNPSKVKGYRLVGYENRLLNNEDFNDDKKDAGELGAGHVVTAFYELIPASSDEKIEGVDELKYQNVSINDSNEYMNIKLRYKEPDGNESKLIELPVDDKYIVNNPTSNFYFASAVAEFGMLLRDSEYKGNANYDDIINIAQEYKGLDLDGYRAEFIKMVKLAKELDK